MNSELLQKAIELHREHCVRNRVDPGDFETLPEDTKEWWRVKARKALKPLPAPEILQKVSVGSRDWLDALISEYDQRWKDTMPTKGKEAEESVLHGMHFEVGNVLKRLRDLKESAF